MSPLQPAVQLGTGSHWLAPLGAWLLELSTQPGVRMPLLRPQLQEIFGPGAVDRLLLLELEEEPVVGLALQKYRDGAKVAVSWLCTCCTFG